MKFLLAILALYAPLAQKAAQTHLAESYPVYHWPFSGMLKERLCHEGSDSVWFFTYGSLINPRSAARTLDRDAVAGAQPAIAFGIRRIFNRDMPPQSFEQRYGPPKSPEARAMLNVEPAEPTSMVNGLLIDVPFEDLTDLCRREEGYDLIPVVIVLWDERGDANPHFRVAYTFSAPKEVERHGRPLVSDDIIPVPGYAKVALEGAAAHGPAFLKFYRESTYAADGKIYSHR